MGGGNTAQAIPSSLVWFQKKKSKIAEYERTFGATLHEFFESYIAYLLQ